MLIQYNNVKYYELNSYYNFNYSKNLYILRKPVLHGFIDIQWILNLTKQLVDVKKIDEKSRRRYL
jgi:hypothetical protein